MSVFEEAMLALALGVPVGLGLGALLLLVEAIFSRRPRILDPRYHSPSRVQASIDRARAARGAPVCEHRPVTTSAGPFCEKCGAEL